MQFWFCLIQVEVIFEERFILKVIFTFNEINCKISFSK